MVMNSDRARTGEGIPAGGEFANQHHDADTVELAHFAPGWPALGYESRPWDADHDRSSSRRVALAARGPYQAAVPALIQDLDIPLGSVDLAATDDATVAFTRFDTEVGLIAAPFSAILLRSESASSSEIENLTSGARAIALAELGHGGSPNAKLIVANVHAMEAAIDLADDLDTQSIIAMQEVLLRDSSPDLTGAFRSSQVWIGGGPISPHNASYVAPHHERVPALMEDLMVFARRTDLPILAQVAIAHAQFETIHPFGDGNGRTGRSLVQSMLRRSGVTRNVTVPVSAGLLQDTKTYFAALTAYRDGRIEPIIEVFTEASFAAVDNGRQLISDLTRVRSEWEATTSARAGSAGSRLLDILGRQPVIDVRAAAAELHVAEQNAQVAIDRLVGDGILVQIGSSQRNRTWQAPPVLAALDDFAKRAKRPTQRH
jgi:Fic family protein